MTRDENGSDGPVHAVTWAIRFPMMWAITFLALAAFLLMDLYFWLESPADYVSTQRSGAIGLSAACASVGSVIPAVGTLVRMVEKRQRSNRWSMSARGTRNTRILASVIVLLVISGGVFVVSIGFGARFAVPLMVILFLPEISLARALSERKIGRTGEVAAGAA